MREQLLWICLAACGRVGFAPVSGDARIADALAIDLPPPGPLVGPPLTTADPVALGPFSPGTRVASISMDGVEDDDPVLTRDELEIFFDTTRDGDHDIYTSRRAAISDPWPVPVLVDELDDGGAEEQPAITADALMLYFVSRRSGEQQIYLATRADRNSLWGNITIVDLLNSPFDDDMGAVSGDDLTLMFSSKRGGAATDDLYVTRRASPTGPWGPVVPVTELNTGTYERQPHLDDHALVLYFAQSGFPSLRVSLRDSPDAAWGLAAPVSELDVAGTEETDPWLSPDLRTLYYTTETTGDTTRDVYIATR